VTAPRVSIVVPCHNGGRFLGGLFASLEAQTFRDFEVIVVDNGSTDETTRQELDYLDGTARVVHQENRYLPGARNRGFREARAELILPLDCDDRLEPSYLAETVPLLTIAASDVAFAFTHCRVVDALEGILPRHLNQFDQLFLNQLTYCMLIRKSAWEAVGGYDETMRDGSEDWEFNIRLSRHRYRGIEVPKPLFIYAIRQDGMLLSHAAKMHGTIWRHIRDKHADLYRIRALLARWRATRGAPSKISPTMAAGLLTAAELLPESWFNKLFYWALMMVREHRISRGRLQVGHTQTEALPLRGVEARTIRES
jgi:glycosyltransferase involved in cell wall biosynthesis